MSEPERTSEFENISKSENNVSTLATDNKTKVLKKFSVVGGIIALAFSVCAIVLFFTLWSLYNVYKMDTILWHPLLIASLVLIIPAMSAGTVSYICGKIASRITKKPMTKIAICGWSMSLTLFWVAVSSLMIGALFHSFIYP